ncbi:MAG: hypothetical protein JO362_06035 [Streptomycetaceae bacterium]|nr:hypothetical protein [Streptomycetaceae bacterium]
MTPADAGKLLAHCAMYDNRQPSRAANMAWSVALKDVPLDQDAFDAVARFYSTPPARPGERLWIQPHDVVTHRKDIRRERLANFVFESTSDDDDPFWLSRYRAQLDAVASGRMPGPSQAPALEGGPHPSIADELAGVGREVPGEVAKVRRAGPLGQHCPVCDAPAGRPCRIGTSGRERRRAHDLRAENAKRAAAGLPPVDVAAREAAKQEEIEKRREASRLALENYRARAEAMPTEDAS